MWRSPDFEPSLPAWRMRLHQAMTQGDVIKVLAVYDEPFWRADALEVIERDWSQEEWTRGAYAATFGIGGLSRHGPDLTRPVGPIHWAGTDLAGVGHMHMEGAIRSGKAAARAVLASG